MSAADPYAAAHTVIPLSWTTALWSMCAAAFLTLAAVHLYIGMKQRAPASLAFALTAASVAVMAGFELTLQKAATAAEYGTILRGAHVAIFFLTVSLVLFVRTYLRAGPPWLAWAVITARGVALLVNFLHAPNLNFESITGLRTVGLLGDRASVAVGVPSRWTRLGELSSVLLFAFLASAAVSVWRRGERRRAAVVGGSMLLFVAVAAGHTALVHAGVITWPYVISFAFLPVVAVMWRELTRDVLRLPELARSLQASDAALHESESQLDLAAHAAHLSVWVWDVARDEIHMSDSARRLRGFSADARIDIERLLATAHPDDRPGVERSIRESLERKGPFDREYRIVLPDGGVRWISAIGVAEANERNEPTFVRAVSIDVTERKLMELEAERHRNELAHLARFTTLGELSGSLAHELNQPLSAILSNAEAAQRFLAQDPPAVGELRDILADIIAEDERAGDVIGRLRALFKKGEVSFQPLHLPGVVDDVLRLTRSELIGNDVSVATELARGIPAVRADRVQIQQVLLNLVKNASDAMSEIPTWDRRIALSVGSDGPGNVRVSVSDSGPGIPDLVLDRLFEPFVTTKPEGIGMGLAVCRTIVEAHRGQIRASNQPGGGAMFEFTLPIAVGAVERA